jgi:hypothetical protein
MQQIYVKPIVRGYPFAFSLRFVDAAGEPIPGFDLSTASRVRGEFRKSAEDSGTPYAVVDTVGGTLSVVDANTIALTISAANTANFVTKAAWIDFARLDGSVWSLVPVRIAWPVEDPVTNPPA